MVEQYSGISGEERRTIVAGSKELSAKTEQKRR